jgi:hypothetical protein
MKTAYRNLFKDFVFWLMFINEMLINEFKNLDHTSCKKMQVLSDLFPVPDFFLTAYIKSSE